MLRTERSDANRTGLELPTSSSAVSDLTAGSRCITDLGWDRPDLAWDRRFPKGPSVLQGVGNVSGKKNFSSIHPSDERHQTLHFTGRSEGRGRPRTEHARYGPRRSIHQQKAGIGGSGYGPGMNRGSGPPCVDPPRSTKSVDRSSSSSGSTRRKRGFNFSSSWVGRRGVETSWVGLNF